MNSEIVQYSGSNRPWGFWATAGFGILVMIFSFIVQIIIAVVFFIFKLAAEDSADPNDIGILRWVETSDMGLLISLSLILSSIFCVGLILLIVRGRKGLTVADYLGLKPASGRSMLIALFITVVFIGGSVLVNLSMDRNVETDVLTDAYTATAMPVLFWLAVVVFAPVFEEVFFRGFLFEGFRASWMRPVGAVLLTSLVWAGFHLQYGLFEIITLFIFGIVLGIVRHKADSLWVPLAMHSFNNFLAMLLLALEVGT